MKNADWEPVSDSAKDFIRRLLKSEPSSRMTIEEALSHPFLTGAAESAASDSEMRSILSNMVTFSSAPRIFSLVMASAARQVKPSSTNVMRKVFDQLDTN